MTLHRPTSHNTHEEHTRSFTQRRAPLCTGPRAGWIPDPAITAPRLPPAICRRSSQPPQRPPGSYSRGPSSPVNICGGSLVLLLAIRHRWDTRRYASISFYKDQTLKGVSALSLKGFSCNQQSPHKVLPLTGFSLSLSARLVSVASLLVTDNAKS